MDVSITEAQSRLPELVRAFEDGEHIVLTREGKAVAQLAPPPPERRTVRFGTMRGRISLRPGWDRAITEEQFLSGDF
jgi:antitoxin (DNA-binding transcriptional repressor) of toxin-antitoxin stability system